MSIATTPTPRRSRLGNRLGMHLRISIPTQEHGPQKPNLRSKPVGRARVADEQAVEHHHGEGDRHQERRSREVPPQSFFHPEKEEGVLDEPEDHLGDHEVLSERAELPRQRHGEKVEHTQGQESGGTCGGSTRRPPGDSPTTCGRDRHGTIAAAKTLPTYRAARAHPSARGIRTSPRL